MSTPIETNTEELQEILQTVYNLPMAGGGSSEPDLVIAYDDTDWNGLSSESQFSLDQTAAVRTYNKLVAGEPVNCVLQAIYWPDSGGWVHATCPMLYATAYPAEGDLSDFRVHFQYDQTWGNRTMRLMSIRIGVDLSNNTAGVVEASARKIYDFTSTNMEEI